MEVDGEVLQHEVQPSPGLQQEVPPPPAEDTGMAARIEVAIRVRPENTFELSQSKHKNIVEVQDDVIFLHPEEDSAHHAGTKRRKPHSYVFDRVYGPTSSQLDIFNGTVKDLLPSIFNGYNSSVFCYGATGAGKTYTMMGDEQSMPGVIPMAVAEVFQMAESHKESQDVVLQLSYSEVYNETIRDLLSEEQRALDFREGEKGGQVAGLTWWEPVDGKDVMRLVEQGNGKRVKAETNVNEASSRSHAILQLLVQTKPKGSGVDTTSQVGKLSLIDLAGSERAAATENRGLRLKEGANINKSLLALGNVINALASSKPGSYIGYRDSKLTRMLKDSLGGNCKTIMITNISPSFLTYEDTHNALKYANRAKNIQVTLKKNETTVHAHVSRYKSIIENLQNQVAYLQEQLTEQRTASKALMEKAGKQGTEESVSPEALDLEEKMRGVAANQYEVAKKIAEHEHVRSETLLKLRKTHAEILRWKHSSAAKGGQEPVRIVTLQADIVMMQSQVSVADCEISNAKADLQNINKADLELKNKIPFLTPADQRYTERVAFPYSARMDKLQADSWLQYHKSREKYWEQRYHDLEGSWMDTNKNIEEMLKQRNAKDVAGIREQLEMGKKWKTLSDIVETSSVQDLLSNDELDKKHLTPSKHDADAMPEGFTPTTLTTMTVCMHEPDGSTKKARPSVGLGINYLEKPRRSTGMDKRSQSGDTNMSSGSESTSVQVAPVPPTTTPAVVPNVAPLPAATVPAIGIPGPAPSAPQQQVRVAPNNSQNSRKQHPPRPMRRANTMIPGAIPSYMKATLSSRSAFKKTEEESTSVNTPRGGPNTPRIQSSTPQQAAKTPGQATPSFLKHTMSSARHEAMTSGTPDGERATLEERRRQRKLSQIASLESSTPNPIPSFMQQSGAGVDQSVKNTALQEV